MKANQYLDLIKLCVSIVLLSLATLIAWTGIGTSTADTLEPAPVEAYPGSKRGRILREHAPRDRLKSIEPFFLDYETGSTRAPSAGNDIT